MEYITKKDLIDCSTPDEPEHENGDDFRRRNEENVRQTDVW